MNPHWREFGRTQEAGKQLGRPSIWQAEPRNSLTRHPCLPWRRRGSTWLNESVDRPLTRRLFDKSLAATSRCPARSQSCGKGQSKSVDLIAAAPWRDFQHCRRAYPSGRAAPSSANCGKRGSIRKHSADSRLHRKIKNNSLLDKGLLKNNQRKSKCRVANGPALADERALRK